MAPTLISVKTAVPNFWSVTAAVAEQANLGPFVADDFFWL